MMNKRNHIYMLFMIAAIILALLLSIALPLATNGHDCTGDCCAICCQIDACHHLLMRLFCIAIVYLFYQMTAVLAFVHKRIRTALFYTPIILKVKLSD